MDFFRIFEQGLSVLVIAVVAFVLFKLSFVVCRQQVAVVVERLGKFRKILKPGLHVIVPFIDRVAKRMSLRVIQLDIRVDTKTMDDVFVRTRVSVQYQVDSDNVYDACYKLEEPKTQIEAYVFDIVRAEVPKKTLDDLFLSKDDISKAVQDSLKDVMREFGYVIRRSLITDISPDEEVAKAVNYSHLFESYGHRTEVGASAST